MSIYGYARVSSKQQNLARQIENLAKYDSTITIYQEKFTGTKIDGRKEFSKLLTKVQQGDVIVFDSVSRMSRNAQEGYALYKELYEKGINLVFLKESHINTEKYRKNLEETVKRHNNMNIEDVDASSGLIKDIIKALETYAFRNIEDDIKNAFKASEEEARIIRERVKEGLREAKKQGKQCGCKKGESRERHNKQAMMQAIVKKSKHFQGSLNDYVLAKVIGISRVTIIKYRRELVEKLQNEKLASISIA